MYTAFEQEYIVHSVLDRRDAIQGMLVKNKANSEMLWLANVVAARALVVQYLDDFLRAEADGSVDELARCFSDQGSLYVLFKYYEGVKLDKYLETRDLTFEEKLELAKTYILGFTRYINAPYVMQMALTQPDNIVFRQEGELRFNFGLGFLQDEKEKANPDRVQENLGRLLERIFVGVPDSKRPQVNIIIQKCQRHIYQQYPEIYKDLNDIKSLAETERQRNEALANKAKSIKSRLIGIGGIAILVASICFALYYFIFNNPAQPVMKHIDSIGTLDLREHPEPSGADDPEAPVYVENAPQERTYEDDESTEE